MTDQDRADDLALQKQRDLDAYVDRMKALCPEVDASGLLVVCMVREARAQGWDLTDLLALITEVWAFQIDMPPPEAPADAIAN